MLSKFRKSFSTSKLQVFSPYSQDLVYETSYKTKEEALSIITKASDFQKSWSKVPLQERINACLKFSDYFTQVFFFFFFYQKNNLKIY